MPVSTTRRLVGVRVNWSSCSCSSIRPPWTLSAGLFMRHKPSASAANGSLGSRSTSTARCLVCYAHLAVSRCMILTYMVRACYRETPADHPLFRPNTEVIIQATAGGKVIARETLKPFRKDVLAKLHAADITRRKKLLEKQKAGRKRLQAVGNVVIDHSAFQKFLTKKPT